MENSGRLAWRGRTADSTGPSQHHICYTPCSQQASPPVLGTIVFLSALAAAVWHLSSNNNNLYGHGESCLLPLLDPSLAAAEGRRSQRQHGAVDHRVPPHPHPNQVLPGRVSVPQATIIGTGNLPTLPVLCLCTLHGEMHIVTLIYPLALAGCQQWMVVSAKGRAFVKVTAGGLRRGPAAGTGLQLPHEGY